ncbi:PCRF domain-containing protein [Candidatus Wolfebacteria bacterium]|nr:PCRF domain-containing protein [Candidatus Wolfebacteria bacterium]
MSDPDFWKNREVADLRIKEIGELNELIKKIDEVDELIKKAEKLFSKDAVISPQRGETPLDSWPRSSDAPSAVGDHARSASETLSQTTFLLLGIQSKLHQLEIERLFTGKYDKQSAIISIYSGAGGQDAEDWAGMLYGMYSGFAERRGWKVKILDESLGDFQSKTGRKPIKNIVFEISAPGGKTDYIYGYLKKESGVHRLVRISPFSPEKKRHTSFALVEVMPEFSEIKEEEFKIPEDDLRVEFFRSSGPGGQNVNKVETAVRIHHIPTGLTGASQAGRSQSQNREKAMNLLKAKLFKLMEDNQIKELNQLRVKVKPEWGSQIRSYVLQPYQLVKDHRTGVETAQVLKVLDGEIDLFIEGEIK